MTAGQVAGGQRGALASRPLADNSQQQSRSESSPSGTARARPRDVISPINARVGAAAGPARGRERFQAKHRSHHRRRRFNSRCVSAEFVVVGI